MIFSAFCVKNNIFLKKKQKIITLKTFLFFYKNQSYYKK